jgi:peptide/nickel transport system permease protein
MGLTRFLIRRILSGLVVLWIVATGTFFLFFSRPVQIVARELAGRAASPQVIAEVIRNLGLNQPILVQYWHFLDNTVHGNLGTSYFTQESVKTILAQDLPITASVVVGAVVLWLIVGIGVGILSATRPRSLFDRLSTVGVLAGLSVPVFVLGELLIIGVFLPLNQHGISWIQTGYYPLSQGLIPWMGHMILPWITLAAVQAAVYTRLSRGSLLDTLGEDYIRTARAKGLTERAVVRQGVRSSINPLVTLVGLEVGSLLGGALLVERVFNIPGVGNLAYEAVIHADFSVVQGTVLLAAMFIIVANIVVDIGYAYLDPRVRYS